MDWIFKRDKMNDTKEAATTTSNDNSNTANTANYSRAVFTFHNAGFDGSRIHIKQMCSNIPQLKTRKIGVKKHDIVLSGEQLADPSSSFIQETLHQLDAVEFKHHNRDLIVHCYLKLSAQHQCIILLYRAQMISFASVVQLIALLLLQQPHTTTKRESAPREELKKHRSLPPHCHFGHLFTSLKQVGNNVSTSDDNDDHIDTNSHNNNNNNINSNTNSHTTNNTNTNTNNNNNTNNNKKNTKHRKHMDDPERNHNNPNSTNDNKDDTRGNNDDNDKGNDQGNTDPSKFDSSIHAAKETLTSITRRLMQVPDYILSNIFTKGTGRNALLHPTEFADNEKRFIPPWERLANKISSSASPPLLSPHEWRRLKLMKCSSLTRVCEAYNCTVQELLLSAVSSAVHRYLKDMQGYFCHRIHCLVHLSGDERHRDHTDSNTTNTNDPNDTTSSNCIIPLDLPYIVDHIERLADMRYRLVQANSNFPLTTLAVQAQKLLGYDALRCAEAVLIYRHLDVDVGTPASASQQCLRKVLVFEAIQPFGEDGNDHLGAAGGFPLAVTSVIHNNILTVSVQSKRTHCVDPDALIDYMQTYLDGLFGKS